MQHILNLLEAQGYRQGGILHFEDGGGTGGEGPGGMGRGGGMGGGGMGGGEGGVGAGPSGGNAVGGDSNTPSFSSVTVSSKGLSAPTGATKNDFGLKDFANIASFISPQVRAATMAATSLMSLADVIAKVSSGEITAADAINAFVKKNVMGFITQKTGLSAPALSAAMNGDLGEAAKAQALSSVNTAINKAGLGAANAAMGAISKAGSGDGSSGPAGSGDGSSKTLDETNALNTNPDVIAALNNAGVNTQTPTGDVASFVKSIQNTATFNPDPLGVLKKRYTPKKDSNFENPDIFNRPIVDPDVNLSDSNDLIDRLYAS